MRIGIILLSFLTQAHAKKLAANDIGDTLDSLEKLTDKLTNKLFEQSLKALRKTHPVAIHSCAAPVHWRHLIRGTNGVRSDCGIFCAAYCDSVVQPQPSNALQLSLGRRHAGLAAAIGPFLVAMPVQHPSRALAAGEFDELRGIQQELRRLPEEETDTKKIFEKLDYLVNDYPFYSRLQSTMDILSPEKRICGSGYAESIIGNLRVLTEYFSLANLSVRSKFYISDSPDNPGQRLDFIKRGLTSVDQDITNFMACYGVFARSGQGENETNWEEYALRFQRGAGWRDVMESENEMEPG